MLVLTGDFITFMNGKEFIEQCGIAEFECSVEDLANDPELREFVASEIIRILDEMFDCLDDIKDALDSIAELDAELSANLEPEIGELTAPDMELGTGTFEGLEQDRSESLNPNVCLA